MRSHELHKAVRVLQVGGVIAYPTEAVFGLGCDPRSEKAVQRLLTLKRRPASKGFILIAASFAQLAPFVETLEATQRARLDSTWPGPVTWLVPAREGVPGWLRGHHDTLAVRITAQPLAAALCRLWGGPLVSTSANISGNPPARSTQAVRRQFGRCVDYVIPGVLGHTRRPTEIRDLQSGRVVRAG